MIITEDDNMISNIGTSRFPCVAIIKHTTFYRLLAKTRPCLLLKSLRRLRKPSIIAARFCRGPVRDWSH
jgi:hypothetical protein